MSTPPRRFLSTFISLSLFYCLVPIIYLAVTITPTQSLPAGTILIAGDTKKTPTDTPVPPTLTDTPVPPTATDTPLPPPTVTNTPLPPPTAMNTGTNTPQPLPTATGTTIPIATTTATPTTTATAIKTPSATITPTPLPGVTPMVTDTPIATSTARPTVTDTPTLSATPLLPTTTATATETPIATLTPTVANAQLALTKTDFLFTDTDNNNLVSPGDKLLYSIIMINTGQSPAQQLHLVDTLDSNTTLVAGTVNTDQGRITQGNRPEDGHVILDLDTLAPGARVALNFRVSIKLQVNDTQVQNQAIVTFVNVNADPAGQTTALSDDPDSPDAFDATVTALNGNQPRPQPKLFLPFVSRKN